MILSPCCYMAQTKTGSDSRRQLAEQEGINRWDWTTDKNEQTMKMNKQWRCCYDFWEGRIWAALRSCSIRLATQLLGMRWIRFARKDKQIVQKRLTGFHKFWQMPPLLVQDLVDGKICLVGKRCLFVNWQGRTNTNDWQMTGSEMKICKTNGQIQLKVKTNTIESAGMKLTVVVKDKYRNEERGWFMILRRNESGEIL